MKTKYLYIISALALGLASCQQGGWNPDTQVNGEMAFRVAAPNQHTRVADGAFEQADQIGLYVTDYVDATTPAPLQISGNRANNEVVSFDGATWSPARPIYWGDGKADVYAYYPYIAEVEDVDDQAFSVATDQSVGGGYEASDLLWAKAAGVQQSGGAVSLQMKHAMSRLVVKIVAGEEYVGSLPADATVHLHSTVTDARFSLANGSVVKDPYGAARSIKMRNLGIRNFAEGKAVVYEAIVVPQMLETSVPLLEINSKSVSYLLEDAFNFKPGTSYTYTATLNTSTTSIKVEIGCELEDWNNIGSGSGDGSGEGGSSEGGVDISGYTNLSAEGTANCYLVKAAGNYKFKAVQGNSDSSVGNVKKVDVLWETFGTDVMPNVGDLIAEAFYQDGYICFSTPATFKNGNASIAARNSKDVILWSWHIWCSEEGWNDHVYANNAGILMDRNLGATSATPGEVGALGLLYQWGRKDPFMGSGTLTGNTFAASTGSWSSVWGGKSVAYTEENPTIFVNNVYASWCSDFNDDSIWRTSDFDKSTYDPCPYGYRVPNGGSDGFWATALGASSNAWNSTIMTWTNHGVIWALTEEAVAWYPATGTINCDGGALIKVGDVGCYRTTTQSKSHLYVNSNSIIAESDFYFQDAYGHAVRCMKE